MEVVVFACGAGNIGEPKELTKRLKATYEKCGVLLSKRNCPATSWRPIILLLSCSGGRFLHRSGSNIGRIVTRFKAAV